MQLQKGANAPLDGTTLEIMWQRQAGKAEVDVSAFLLTAAGKVTGDEGMVFYGQTMVPGASLQSSQPDRRAAFALDLDRLPAAIERIAFCVALDTAADPGRRLADVGAVTMRAGSHLFEIDLAGATEQAIVVAEIYRRNGAFKVRAVGQGFDGGLQPLAEQFGVQIAAPAPAPAPAAPAPAPALNLRKQRLVNLEKSDPKLVSLAKTAAVSLEKKGIGDSTARVWLVLDISASMLSLVRCGAVDRLVQRILALGLNMDDDGNIDCAAFGMKAHNLGSVDAGTYATFVSKLMKSHGLEPGTYYGKVMKLVRETARRQPDFGRVPVFVMFVTDGGTGDPAFSETQIREAAAEGIFWQFMAIGEMPRALPKMSKRKSLPRGFDFLAMLDDMPGRVVDNASFFSVSDPDDVTDAELYDLLMEEYPMWLKAARAAGILA